jgi:TRAP-type C4-dicarboxylate transport system permease small subunit
MQIIFREFMSFTMNWSDEASQIFMMWMVFIGAIWCTKNGQHVTAGYRMHQNLNEKQTYLIDGILDLLIAICTAAVSYHTAIYAFSLLGADSTSLPWLKIGYIHLVQPFALLVLSAFYLKNSFKKLAGIFLNNR